MDLLRRIGHVLGVLGMVLIFALWLFAAAIDISLGCPPPPFAHRCLMKQAGVLPPYYATEESEGDEELDIPHTDYINKSGEAVPLPVHLNERPQNATAQCYNGAYSFSKSRSGTCSKEGGVAEWYW